MAATPELTRLDDLVGKHGALVKKAQQQYEDTLFTSVADQQRAIATAYNALQSAKQACDVAVDNMFNEIERWATANHIEPVRRD